jgi:hypothetical protein
MLRPSRLGEAYRALRSADEATPLQAGDLELLATAACLTGREAEFLRILERQYRVHDGALIDQGHVVAGLKRLDETMLAVVAGELLPIMTGLLYCSVIDTCRQVYALGRAREWTSAFRACAINSPRWSRSAGRAWCIVPRSCSCRERGPTR